ncbi:enoyl-CoA hydratase/isomerase family protein [Thermodesulfobacteriota bacterium]
MDPVLCEVADRVMTITLNRPEIRNAMDADSMALVLDFLYRAAEDRSVRVVVLTGAGEGFCSGADVRRIGEGGRTGTTRRLRERHHVAIRMFREMEKPTMAAVNGAAVGLGCDFALACDLRIASDRAFFGEIFVQRGIIPDCGGTWLLPRIVGLGKTFEMIYLGDRVTADEAHRIGMVNRVVPHDRFGEETTALAARLAEGPPIAYAQAKRAVNAGLENEIAGQMVCLESEDKEEGVRAWKEKRPPRFKGR